MLAWALTGLAGCVDGSTLAGRRALDDGHYEHAAHHFRIAAEEDPTDAARWNELGRAELAANRPARARRAFERLAALRPQSAGPRLYIGYTWELERRYDEALIAYRQARARAPHDARAHRVLGTRLLRWGQARAALPPLRRAVVLDPEHAETWNALALAHHHAKDRPGAIATFRRAMVRHPDSVRLKFGLAAILINLGRYDAALELYDQVAAKRPDFAAVHAGRAILLHELGRPAEAERAFARAAEVARDPRPYRARLVRYRRLSR